MLDVRILVFTALDNAVENGFPPDRSNISQVAIDLGTYDSDLEGRDDLEPYISEWFKGEVECIT